MTSRCITPTKKTGERCGAPIALGERCWVHGGAGLRGPCSLTMDGGTPMIWLCDETGKPRGKPRAASKWAATQFVLRGIVTHGYFVVRPGANRDVQNIERFVRRLERAGARVVPVRLGLVRVYRFEGTRSCAHSVLDVAPVPPGQDPFSGLHTCESCGEVVEFENDNERPNQ